MTRQSLRRFMILGLILSLGAGTTWCAFQERLQRRPGFNCDDIGIVQGEWGKGRTAWKDVPGKAGTQFRIFAKADPADAASAAVSGYYLNYNHKQEDPVVLLAKDPGPGTEWQIREIEKRKNRGGFGYRIFTRISPVNGPMKGWILTVSEDKFVLKPDGVPAPVYAYIDDLNDGK